MAAFIIIRRSHRDDTYYDDRWKIYHSEKKGMDAKQ